MQQTQDFGIIQQACKLQTYRPGSLLRNIGVLSSIHEKIGRHIAYQHRCNLNFNTFRIYFLDLILLNLARKNLALGLELNNTSVETAYLNDRDDNNAEKRCEGYSNEKFLQAHDVVFCEEVVFEIQSFGGWLVSYLLGINATLDLR